MSRSVATTVGSFALVVLCVGDVSAAPVIDYTFHFRAFRSANNVGQTAGDRTDIGVAASGPVGPSAMWSGVCQRSPFSAQALSRPQRRYGIAVHAGHEGGTRRNQGDTIGGQGFMVGTGPWCDPA